jgi:hypothetical protein
MVVFNEDVKEAWKLYTTLMNLHKIVIEIKT